MDLYPSESERALADAVAQVAARRGGLAARREGLAAGELASREEWQAFGEVGVFSLGLPADAGGADCPIVEESLVFEQLGRAFAPLGFVASVLAARIAYAAGDADLCAKLADGSAVATLGLCRSPLRDSAEATVDVLDFELADYVLVADSSAVELVAADACVVRDSVAGVDPLSSLTTVTVDGDAVEQGATSAKLHALGTLLAAAQMAGVAELARDSAVLYAKERVQFGRPIGSNQAVKHPCADMAVRCLAVTSQVRYASVALRDRHPDWLFQTTAAKRLGGIAAIRNSRAALQIHGGMGFTWDGPSHLLVSRAHLLDRAFGSRTEQQHVLANSHASADPGAVVA
jgi:alkylation response protein AidB-like acyl-CoA dehydrogenase